MGIEFKGTSPILHGKKNVNNKQLHPVKDFPEAAAAKKKAEEEAEKQGSGELKQGKRG